LAIALAECCISGGRGATIQLPIDASFQGRWDTLLVGESGARIIVSVSPEHQAEWEAHLADRMGDRWCPLGTVGTSTDGLTLQMTDGQHLINLGIQDMGDRWRTAITRRMAG
jgi:phosphoribosylformylglycinamidine synthase